jgi:hypothetical protein
VSRAERSDEPRHQPADRGGVLASTAATDAAYVFFNAAVSSRRRVWAARWSAIW